jgi:PAS domain S-box-containing protein
LRHYLEQILSALNEAVLLLDPEWRILYANQNACRISGPTREQLIGNTLWKAYPSTAGTELERK